MFFRTQPKGPIPSMGPYSERFHHLPVAPRLEAKALANESSKSKQEQYLKAKCNPLQTHILEITISVSRSHTDRMLV